MSVVYHLVISIDINPRRKEVAMSEWLSCDLITGN